MQRISAGSTSKTAQILAKVSNAGIARPEKYCATDCGTTPICLANSVCVIPLCLIASISFDLILSMYIIMH